MRHRDSPSPEAWMTRAHSDLTLANLPPLLGSAEIDVWR